ncbi:TetR/AcrR family transcriptional regulator [Halobacillus yeomjeoni]|uniref:TetR/AcrR family transcriptional regulator n=1 Tax=Halobacillus yeomjeoni TaxID=311194 RepID=A0A931HWX3_9BACI|nr:TetR/AcrR family transcriptional regulator [Halobacillus yeomjeoni]MBH0231170.1 TetR/AcrR family transcriptional regulator [Halobacillus yeomjeoni]MCA0984085.1 TetR/AcrR family transcriptional regulator [Halobacillus yeomjeoni]
MAKKAETRKQQILKAAFQAASEKGYESVTLQDIADYADVSKGVTNYYFKNKADVFAHLFEWITGRIYEKEAASIHEQETAVKMLEAYINQVFISPAENKTFYRVYVDYLSQIKNNKAYQEINQQFYENCWSIGRSIINKGLEENVFSVNDIEEATISIRCIIDGSLIQWLMREDDQLHDYYKSICYDSILRVLNYKE